MNEMKTGDEVFTIDGSCVELVAHVNGEFVVRPIYDYEGEKHTGDPVALKQIFPSAPVERWDKRVAELREEIDRLRVERDAAKAEAQAQKEDEKSARDRIAKVDAMKRIDDFLSGRITHFVYYQWSGIKIMSWEDSVKYKESEYDKVPKGVRLLTLFGKTNGDLAWRLNKYSDGSGSNDEVFACCSHDEALAEATRLIESRYAEWRKDGKATHYATEAAKSAESIGLVVPDDVRDMVRCETINELKRHRDIQQKAFSDSAAKLAAYEADINKEIT